VPAEHKHINFGKIDHFLYVRINCVCADLGYTIRDLVEQAYFLLTELITEQGVTQLWLLKEEYEKYSDYREKSRYSPRMLKKSHPLVVQGIHEEIYDHLVVIKEENSFSWIVILRILLMVMEANLDKIDAEIWKKVERREAIIQEFRERRTANLARSPASRLEDADGYTIEKTKKRYKYERSINKYPESKEFRMRKV
jgi:predicted CopG family antitoxin